MKQTKTDYDFVVEGFLNALSNVSSRFFVVKRKALDACVKSDQTNRASYNDK